MDVYARAAQWRGGASFPGFINLLFESTIKDFSDAEKQMAYGKVPQFAPLTEAELAAAAASAARGPRPAANPGIARSRGIRAISREETFDEQIFTPLRTPAAAVHGAGRTSSRRARSATASARSAPTSAPTSPRWRRASRSATSSRRSCGRRGRCRISTRASRSRPPTSRRCSAWSPARTPTRSPCR